MIDFPVSQDARVVYVSTAGDDANSGLFDNLPKRSISAGLALMRHNMPDRLLLKRGDIFPAGDVPNAGYKWITSGRSSSEPAVLSVYGDVSLGRARIVTDGRGGFRFTGGGGSPLSIENVAIIGIDLFSGNRDAMLQNPTGIRMQINMRNVWIEDCKIVGFDNGISAQTNQGVIANLTIRENVIAECYSGTNVHSQGIYLDEVDNVLIDGNIIDHAGWSETYPSAPPDIFKHAIYVQGDARGVVVSRNIITNPSSHGVQLRSGGDCLNNVFIKCPIAILMAGNGVVEGNVILDGRDITAALPRKQGIHIQNVTDGVSVIGNIIANSTPGTRSKAISITQLIEAGKPLGVRNALIADNVISEWGGTGLEVENILGWFESVTVAGNDFQNHADGEPLVNHRIQGQLTAFSMLDNQWLGAGMSIQSKTLSITDYLLTMNDSTSQTVDVPYPYAAANIANYHFRNGGEASYDAFIREALLQSRGSNWRPKYTAGNILRYFRRCFAQ